MLKLVSYRNSVLARIADCPVNNHVPTVLYESLAKIFIEKNSIMKKISTKTFLISIATIILWMIGSHFILKENSSFTTIIIVAIIILTGLYSQIKKDIRINSEK